MQVPITVQTDDLSTTTRFYEQAIGVPVDPDIDLGSEILTARTVGPILIVAGPESALREVSRLRGIIFVDDLPAAIKSAMADGATIAKEPTSLGGGQLAHLRHPDGSIFEYLKT